MTRPDTTSSVVDSNGAVGKMNAVVDGPNVIVDISVSPPPSGSVNEGDAVRIVQLISEAAGSGSIGPYQVCHVIIHPMIISDVFRSSMWDRSSLPRHHHR